MFWNSFSQQLLKVLLFTKKPWQLSQTQMFTGCWHDYQVVCSALSCPWAPRQQCMGKGSSTSINHPLCRLLWDAVCGLLVHWLVPLFKWSSLGKKKKKKVWSFSYSVVHNWVDTKPARQNNAAQLTFLFQNSKWKLPAKESPLYVRPSLWEVGKIQTDRFLFQGWSAPVPTLSGVTNMCKWTVQVNFILFCCKQR